MQILQNVDVLNLKIPANIRTVFFRNSKFINRKVHSIYFESQHSTNFSLISPYLDLYDITGKKIINSLDLSNVDLGSSSSANKRYELEINALIDWDKTNISRRADFMFDEDFDVKVYVSYYTEPLQRFSDEISGCETVVFTDKKIFNIKLSDLIHDRLRGLAIKKINTNFEGGIQVVGINDRMLNLLHQKFLHTTGSKTFYLDPIIIDEERSYLIGKNKYNSDQNANHSHSITFYY